MFLSSFQIFSTSRIKVITICVKCIFIISRTIAIQLIIVAYEIGVIVDVVICILIIVFLCIIVVISFDLVIYVFIVVLINIVIVTIMIIFDLVFYFIAIVHTFGSHRFRGQLARGIIIIEWIMTCVWIILTIIYIVGSMVVMVSTDVVAPVLIMP